MSSTTPINDKEIPRDKSERGQTVRYIDKHRFLDKMNKPDVRYLDHSVLELVEMDYVLEYRLLPLAIPEKELAHYFFRSKTLTFCFSSLSFLNCSLFSRNFQPFSLYKNKINLLSLTNETYISLCSSISLCNRIFSF